MRVQRSPVPLFDPHERGDALDVAFSFAFSRSGTLASCCTRAEGALSPAF